MKTITFDDVKAWGACYLGDGRADQLTAMFETPRTPLEVLTLDEGPWAEVPISDRWWAVLREGVLPDALLRLFAVWCAEQVLHVYESAYPNDPRPRAAIQAARQLVRGEVGDTALAVAAVAAWSAALRSAQGAAAGQAARAARAAALAVAADAARAAARAAAWAAGDAARAAGDAAWAAGGAARAAEDAAGDAQITKLAEMVRIWQDTGDIYGGEK